MVKKRILHIMGIMGKGGVETMVIQLCNNLDKEKFETSIFSYSLEENVRQKINHDVKVLSSGYREDEICGWKFFLHIISIIRKIVLTLKTINPDIIHIHTTASRYLLISILSIFCCKKTLFIKTVHTSGYLFTSHSLSDKFRLFLEKLAVSIRKTHIVGISKQVNEINNQQFSNLAKSFSIIYNGVDIKAFQKKNNTETYHNNKIIVSYVARIVPGKNHIFLIYLWKKIIEEYNLNIQLLFVGDGILLTQIKKIINENQLNSHIKCLGSCDNIPQILNSCDFAVFPSEFEGFGIALIEKMAAQLPVIVSDIPPFREIITNKVDGFIIDTQNESEWIKTIKLLSKNKEIRSQIGKAALEKSKTYSIEKMICQYESLYLNI